MRICDRCFKLDGSAKMAVDEIILKSEDRRMDVCESCREESITFIFEPKPKPRRGRTPVKGE